MIDASQTIESCFDNYELLCPEVHALKDLIDKLDLTISARVLPGIFDVLEISGGPLECKAAGIRPAIEKLAEWIEGELSCRLVLLIDSESAALYEEEHPFGKDVSGAFPLGAREVRDAARCMAFEQWTAAVFHLMRALETVLRALARTLGVALENPNWHQALNHVDRIVKALNEQDRKDGFYAETSLYLRGVRHAWRNPVSHADARVSKGQARMVWSAVENFMRHTATQLSE